MVSLSTMASWNRELQNIGLLLVYSSRTLEKLVAIGNVYEFSLKNDVYCSFVLFLLHMVLREKFYSVLKGRFLRRSTRDS